MPRHYTVNLKSSILIENPTLLAGDVVCRAYVSPDLGVGDSAVLDECSINKSLPALDRKRHRSGLADGEPIGVDDELRLQPARPVLKTKPDTGVLVEPGGGLVLHPHRPVRRDLAIDRLNGRGVGLDR